MKNYFKKIPLLLSFMFFIAFSLVFVFLYREVKNNNAQAEQNAIILEKEMQKRENIIAIDHSLKEIENERMQLQNHFAESSDIVPFLDTIEKLAPAAGAVVQVDSVNTLPKNTGLIVGLKASGSFQAVYKFLALLENSPYELDFLSMDMHRSAAEAPNKNTKNPKWEAVFRIQLLSFIP